MEILSITVSVEDNKLFYIKKVEEEEGAFKFSCHHFTFDADNHAEVTLNENGIIESITPYKKSLPTESTSLTSRSVANSNVNSELKFSTNSRNSVVIIDVESYLQREVQLDTPIMDSSDNTDLLSEAIKKKLIISIEKLTDELGGLKFHAESLTAEPATQIL